MENLKPNEYDSNNESDRFPNCTFNIQTATKLNFQNVILKSK